MKKGISITENLEIVRDRVRIGICIQRVPGAENDDRVRDIGCTGGMDWDSFAEKTDSAKFAARENLSFDRRSFSSVCPIRDSKVLSSGSSRPKLAL